MYLVPTTTAPVAEPEYSPVVVPDGADRTKRPYGARRERRMTTIGRCETRECQNEGELTWVGDVQRCDECVQAFLGYGIIQEDGAGGYIYVEDDPYA